MIFSLKNSCWSICFDVYHYNELFLLKSPVMMLSFQLQPNFLGVCESVAYFTIGQILLQQQIHLISVFKSNQGITSQSNSG